MGAAQTLTWTETACIRPALLNMAAAKAATLSPMAHEV